MCIKTRGFFFAFLEHSQYFICKDYIENTKCGHHNCMSFTVCLMENSGKNDVGFSCLKPMVIKHKTQCLLPFECNERRSLG